MPQRTLNGWPHVLEKPANLYRAHNVVVAFALLSCLDSTWFYWTWKSYQIFVPWSGKPYLPFDIAPAYVAFYGIIFTLFAMFYSILGHAHVVQRPDQVYHNDCACIAVAIIASQHLRANTEAVPDGWFNPFFNWNLDIDWSRLIPATDKNYEDGFGLLASSL